MALRDFDAIRYNPLLCVRPAEMTALQELPERDKDLLFPHILLRPWLGSHQLESTTKRIETAYGRRPVGVEISPVEEDFAGARRPVHDEIEDLRNSADGFRNWVDFVAQHENYVPVLQITDVSELARQAEQLAELERGLILRIPEEAIGRAEQIVRTMSAVLDPSETLIMLDYERATRQIQTRQAACATLIDRISDLLPGCFISISASSFPESFTSMHSQEIYERTFFNGVIQAAGSEGMIYSDRGSARVERQTGGGGAPAPRVDLALAEQWQFFREEGEEDRADLYERAAGRAMASDGWDPALRVWGTQLIEQTALGIPGGIGTPLKSTSVRINIHLHRQLFYGQDPDLLHNTDEDWSD